MPLEIVTSTDLSDVRQGQVLRHVTRNRFIDYRNQFTVDDSTVRTARRVHVTETPLPGAGESSPFPWKGQGFPIDPFITIEDEDGQLVGLQHCRLATDFAHALGTVYKRPSDGSLWLFEPAEPDQGFVTIADLASKAYKLTAIHGQSDEAIAENGSYSEIKSVIEGEFYYSIEDKPLILTSPWSAPNVFDGISDERRIEAEALEAALGVAVDRALEASSSPEII